MGNETSDDAGVYQLRDDLAIVQTVDFFTPVVDDPYDFGAVAAANALSDVYAMGGRPVTALNLVGFPTDRLPIAILHEILRGGADKAVEAEVAILGGHSIDDAEPKYGMAVTGVVHPGRMLTNRAGAAGDLLVLTKPLGVGILTTAIKRGLLDPEATRDVVRLMTHLNRGASEAAIAHGLRAATDITGYGLLGHTHELALGSGLRAVLHGPSVPLFSPQVRELADQGVAPGGSRKNLLFIQQHTTFGEGVDPILRLILADAQTSGGLLLAVPPQKLSGLLASLVEHGTPAAAVVGRLEAGEPGSIEVRDEPVPSRT